MNVNNLLLGNGSTLFCAELYAVLSYCLVFLVISVDN